MKNLKNQKGITLIALIITIIVMLILVAVTINVALNGGLFKKASESAEKTEKQSIYEQTVAAMVLDDNGDFNVNETGKAAEAHFKENGLDATWNNSTGKLTVVGKRGTYEIIISSEGIGQPTIKTVGNEVPPTPPVSGYIYLNEDMELVDENGTVLENQDVTKPDWIKIPTEGDSIVYVYMGNAESLTLTENINVNEASFIELDNGDTIFKIDLGEEIQETVVGKNIYFNSSPNLRSVNLNNIAISSSTGVFQGLRNLQNVTGLDSVNTVEDYFFGDCEELSSITLNSVTRIGADAFHNCGVQTLTLPGSGISSFENNAFEGCNNLTKIIINGPEAECDYKTELESKLGILSQNVTIQYTETGE